MNNRQIAQEIIHAEYYPEVDDTQRLENAITTALDAKDREKCECGEQLREQDATIARLVDATETAWGVIANVSGSDWQQQNVEWQDAAARWREQYHTLLTLLARLRGQAELKRSIHTEWAGHEA